MKVVGISNFAHESVSDVLHAQGLTQKAADYAAKCLNKALDKRAVYFYVVKPESYVLYEFKP